jgi:hypothetical protein
MMSGCCNGGVSGATRVEEYRESVAEMRFHVEQETEHNLRSGMSPR